VEHLNREDSDLVEMAIQMEAEYAQHCHTGSETGPALFMLQGAVPIIISSPHAVKHPRGDRLKKSEILTGPLARQLASLTQTSVLVYARTYKEDPNYDPDGPYKQQLLRLAKSTSARFVLDLHGLKQEREEDIFVGTAGGETLGEQPEIRDVFTKELTKAGFTNIVIDDPELFSAAGSTTITSFIWHELRVPAMQVEIHRKYRDAKHAPDNYLKILYALRDGIQTVQRILEKTK
jgi:hypothetical protein